MTTYNTGNPLGSAAAKDLCDNSQNFDHLSNDRENETWPDRFGVPRLTWYGMEKMNESAIAGYGWILTDSFQDGATLTEPNQALRWKLPDGNGEYYRWDGDFPKSVPTGSTPDTTGGVGSGAWLSVGDAILRTNLADSEGYKLVGGLRNNFYRMFDNVSAMKADDTLSVGDVIATRGLHLQVIKVEPYIPSPHLQLLTTAMYMK